MKVAINLKKETPFKKLFVKTLEKAMFDKIVAKLKKDGADNEKSVSSLKKTITTEKLAISSI